MDLAETGPSMYNICKTNFLASGGSDLITKKLSALL